MMAVRPKFQGQGHGSRLLAHVLEAARSELPSTPTTLTTHQTRNVTYYERLGFSITNERTLHPPGASPYTVWSMRSA
jgi:GNAT superfamily N-acetyltransferase